MLHGDMAMRLTRGQRVRVYWASEDEFFFGTVAHDVTDDVLQVTYDDGDERNTTLSLTNAIILHDPTELRIWEYHNAHLYTKTPYTSLPGVKVATTLFVRFSSNLWAATLLHPSEGSLHVHKARRTPKQVLVQFIGDDTIAWVNPENVEPFDESVAHVELQAILTHRATARTDGILRALGA